MRIKEDICVVNEALIGVLKGLAKTSPKKRSRACLHRDSESAVQEMVIVLYGSSYVRPHRHPKHKSESYHVIEGELDVKIYEEDGRLFETIHLGKNAPLYRLRNGWFHEPVPRSEWVVYHETYTGPFDKERDVEYAVWAAEEV